MGLDYRNLDATTRKYMLEELEISVAEGKIYISNYLSEVGKVDWLHLLRSACENGTDVSLGSELRMGGRLNSRALRKKPKGGFTEVDVPVTAHETLSEGQFNRLYIRALCRRAEADGHVTVKIYRAAEREHERTASVALIGSDVDAAELLAKLRNALDFNSGFPEPSTGLCVTHS
jgi:hypothetical protein